MSILRKPILQNQTFLKSLLNRSRTMTSSTETHEKPLSVLFEEVVGLRPEEDSNKSKRKISGIESKLMEMKKSEPMRTKKKEKIQNLYTLFKSNRQDLVKVYKEIPLEMVSFVKLLYKEGYLKNANILRGEEFDVKSFDDEFARAFVKFAAEKFGNDHQEIAKWLYGSDLKKIVLFGCPSLEKRAIFAAKTLRNFFDIQENNVCEKCVLKDKCKYRNKSVWDGKTKNLHLSVVMKVITQYPLDLTHPNLQVPQEVHDSVLRLLTEIQNLSRTISTPLT